MIRMIDACVSARARLEHLDDLRLDRHVERRRRLVRDQDARVVGDRHRDHGPLSHPAGELVRVLVDAPLGEGHPDELQQLDRPRARVVLAHAGVVHLDGLPDLVADRQDRVQRGHRVLEDHRHVAAPDLPELALRHLDQVAALEHRLTLDHAPGRLRNQSEHRHHRHALARPRLAHDAEDLTRLQVVGDVGHRADYPVFGLELDGQVLNREDRLSHELSAASDRVRHAARPR